jgi:hypothetical protein
MLIPVHPTKLTFGAGGFAVFGLFLAAVEPVSKAQMILFCAASLTPYLLLLLFGPESSPRHGLSRGCLLGQRVAVVWYLAAYVGAFSLAVRDGLSAPEMVFLLAALLGIWPCAIALTRWRTVQRNATAWPSTPMSGVPPTRTGFLRLVFVATLLSVMALLLAPLGPKRIHQALEQGYVDVGEKKRSGSSEYSWKARHTLSERPWRFYASLVPSLSAPLFLVLSACVGWLQVLQFVLTGSSQLVGHLRTASVWVGGTAALAGLCTLFFWFPLK